MTATNHALTGAIIGLAIHDPWVALPAALLSHMVCDALPHYGARRGAGIASRGYQIYLMAEAALCVLLVAILFISGNPSWFQAAICAFLATSPDLLWIRKFIAVKAGRSFHPTMLDRFLGGIQWFERPIGAAVEIAWAGAAIAVLSQII